MSVWVAEEDLHEAVRARLRGRNDFHSQFLSAAVRGLSVVDEERKVMRPRGAELLRQWISGWRRTDVFEDQMDLSRSRLEPQTGELKRRPRRFTHAETVNI